MADEAKKQETQNTWLGAVFIVGIVAWLFWPGSNPVSSSPQKQEWYQGGTLHSASLASWHTATKQNRLATAADWTTGIIGQDEFARIGLEGVRKLATDLAICVDESTDGLDEIHKLKAAEIAATCAVLMGIG